MCLLHSNATLHSNASIRETGIIDKLMVREYVRMFCVCGTELSMYVCEYIRMYVCVYVRMYVCVCGTEMLS